MSIAPQALERSVLERKERDELAAIAEAMGVKPSSRASKATLIDQILREAGIETAPEAKPRRTRAPRANGSAAAEPPPAVVDAVETATADLGAPSPAGPVDTVEVKPPAAAPSDGQPSAAAEPTGPAAKAADAAEPAAGAGPAARTAAPDEAAPAQPAEAAQAAQPVQPAQEGTTPTPVAPVAGGGPSPAGEPSGDQQGQPASGRSSGDQQGQPRTNDRRDRGQGGRDRGDQQGNRGNQPYDSAGADPGNRRSRRRRGRDRGDRDIQQDRGQDVPFSGEPIPVDGLLDLRDEGYGFLRTNGYLASPNDVYVSLSQVRRFGLRKGDMVTGASRPATSTEKYPALLRIDTVNGMSVEEARNRPRFEDLTPLFPDQKLRLEVPGDSNNMVARIVDLISPIGKGQRGLIVSPPKAGKTTVLKQIAHSIEANNPDVHLMVLLVDERPEEVTDMRRSVKGEVIASTFDRPSDEHTQVAELAIERAKRLVEMGKDVVIVLDGITRLARAYNLAAPATGRIMSGGIDTGALYPPKKFFGSARNIEEGGSLTILATALVETGSRMDEVIFEEFKGTGNMELRLDRKLAERRIYPALEVNASSTRHEELLFDRGQLQQIWKLRRVLNALEGGAGLELLMDKIKTTKSNDEFLAEIAKAPTPAA